jgi:hypothetical protein
VGTVLDVSDPYRPGQYPPPGLDQTTRIPAVRSQQPMRSRAPEPPRSKTREYVLKGLGLLLVSVLSGMLWWLIQQGGDHKPTDAGASTPAQPQTKFKFVKHEQVTTPAVDSNCERNSYEKVKAFFAKKPCTQMVRELYVTTVDGKKAYSSVAMVRMSSAADAEELKALTEQNGTGNVTDLVRDGRIKVPGLKSLSNGAFAAKAEGTDVIIVESDFEGGSKKEDDAKLEEISDDAVMMGEALRK